ncbi:MAG: hypothetical protein ACYDHU_02425 [Acidimicrobiales bacterium]
MHGTFRIVGLVLGLVVVVGSVSSVFTTLVVPRATSSRLLRSISRVLARAAHRLTRLLRTYDGKDRLLSLIGPFAMILLFAVWLGWLVVGFGLLVWWDSGTTLAHAFAVAGSSVFTLGIISAPGRATEAVEIAAAGTGLLVVALEIAYLPTLYGAFAARETEVTLLATRAGVPAWGPEILARHHWFRTTSELPDLYRTWERWSAAVAESHTNYPSLMWFRSPVPWRSWLTGLVAMLDAAALHDAIDPGSSPRQARICLQMGVNTLRSLAQALRIDFDPDPLPTTPIRLTYEEYLTGISRLEEVDFPFERSPAEAWPHFCGWRVNYESIVDALTWAVVPPPAPWFLPRPWLGELRRPRVRDRTPEDPLGGSGVGG